MKKGICNDGFIDRKIKFGKYVNYSCLKGFENSDTKIMVIQSSDDDGISSENNYKQFYKKFGNNSRFTFIEYDNRTHSGAKRQLLFVRRV